MRNSRQDKVLRAMFSCSGMVQSLHSKKLNGIHFEIIMQQNYRLHVWCNSAYACKYVVSCRQTTTSLLYAQFMKTSLYKYGGGVPGYEKLVCISESGPLYAHMYLSA